MVVNDEEGIRPLNAFYCALRVPSYSLEEAAHLVGLGLGPGGGVLWVFVELSILHGWPVSSSSTGKAMSSVPVVCALVR